MTDEKAFGVEGDFFLLAKPERLGYSQQPITIDSNAGCATTSFIRNIAFDFLFNCPMHRQNYSVTGAAKAVVIAVAYHTPESLQ